MSKLFSVPGTNYKLNPGGTQIPEEKRAGGWAPGASLRLPGKPVSAELETRIMGGASTDEERAARLVEYAKHLSLNTFRLDEMEQIRQLAEKHLTDAHGRHVPELQNALYGIEALRQTFTQGAAGRFQTLVAEVGAKMNAPARLPEDNRVLWQIRQSPLLNFQSTPKLPARVDYVVIGSGLAGSSAALGFAEKAPGSAVAVLEMENAPAQQASGRNGGNFEAIAENFYSAYKGLVHERYQFLKATRPEMSEDNLQQLAKEEAAFHINWGKKNAAFLKRVIDTHHIDCDFSPHGWVRIAETVEEEHAIANEVRLLANSGVECEFWCAEQVREKLKLPAQFGARVVPSNGNYHPTKYVDGAMQAAIKQGVGYYTNTKVVKLEPHASGVTIHTNRGTIEAQRVILATNAFTSELVPELDAIQYYQSQVLNLEHVHNTIQGTTTTQKQGDLYFNFPKQQQYTDEEHVQRGTAHVGGGADRPGANPYRLRRSQQVMDDVLALAVERFDDVEGQPPSRVSTGPMGFTPDRFPMIGFLKRNEADDNRIIIAQACNGYGGTQALWAGYSATDLALTGKDSSEIPQNMVSPNRFLKR